MSRRVVWWDHAERGWPVGLSFSYCFEDSCKRSCQVVNAERNIRRIEKDLCVATLELSFRSLLRVTVAIEMGDEVEVYDGRVNRI